MDADGIVSVLSHFNDGKLKRDARNVWIRCPFAERTHPSGGDHTPSFSIKIDSDAPSVFICWGCKETGTLSDLVYRVNRARGGLQDLVRQVEESESSLLITSAGRRVGELDADGVIKPRNGTRATIHTPGERVMHQDEIKPYIGKVPSYVLDRGISIDTCREWGLGYDADQWDPRLIFPVWSWEHHLVGIVGRRLNEQRMPKYRNYVGFQSERFFYGEHQIEMERDESSPIIIVEGMLDVLWLAQHGIGRPLGLLGSAWTRHRLAKLQAFAGHRTILTLFDGDDAGDRCRAQAQKHLSGYVPILQYTPPPGMDPQSMGPEELANLLFGR